MHCRHFGVCGGCSLPGVPYAEQLAAKHTRLRGWFPDIDVPALVPSPEESRFRHKVAFVFGPSRRGDGLAMGHYQRGSRRIVAVEECPVHTDRGNELAFRLRDRLARSRVPPALLRHVIIRTTASGAEASVMLVVRANHKSLRAPIRAFLEDSARPTGFFLNIHEGPGPFMIGPETIRIDGRSHVRENSLGAGFLVSPTAFFQTNVGAARVLLTLVDGLVGPARRVLDLYSGSGLFAVPLAMRGVSVVAVEENRAAVRDAEQNLRINRVDPARVRLVAKKVDDALPGLPGSGFDAVILDPPRQGCPERVLARLVERLRPPLIVYVSCNPERLAVERRTLERGGYTVASLQGLDMFPHTEHVEAVAEFRLSAECGGECGAQGAEGGVRSKS